jgi:hypothetical protein
MFKQIKSFTFSLNDFDEYETFIMKENLRNYLIEELNDELNIIFQNLYFGLHKSINIKLV